MVVLLVLLQHRIASITADEKAKIKQMNAENYSTKEILLSIRNINPNTALILQDIYNLLASLQIDELDG